MSVLKGGAQQFLANKSSLTLYRDLLRVAHHLVKSKSMNPTILDSVRSSFRRNRNELDPEKIHELKNDALRAISSVVMFQSHGNQVFSDPQVEEAEFVDTDIVDIITPENFQTSPALIHENDSEELGEEELLYAKHTVEKLEAQIASQIDKELEKSS